MSTSTGWEVRGSRKADGETDKTRKNTETGTLPHRRGRALHATRPYAPGEAIADFRAPLVVVPLGAAASLICNYCLNPHVQGRSVKACTGCRAVAYCGSPCQRAHWSAVHKLECRVLKKALAEAAAAEAEKAEKARRESATDPDPDTDAHEDTSSALIRAAAPKYVPAPVRALLQIMLRWPSVREAVDGLEGNVEAFRGRTDFWKDLRVQASAACSFAGWTASDENLATATELMCKIHTNAFDRSDPDIGDSGIFLDVDLAMVNHSCVPNAIVAFAGRRAVLRAEQAIRSGDEITISYIDYTKPRGARHRGLDLYHFVCDCPRCKDDLDVYQVGRRLLSSTPSPSVVALNAFSFVPDLASRLRHETKALPPLSGDRREEIYAACRPEESVAAVATPAARLAHLRRQWSLCQPLVSAQRWAEEPLAHVLQQAIVYYSEQGNFAHALAVECFVALHSDPYKRVAPFAQWRLKGLLLIAKTITNTALEPASESESAPSSSSSSSVVHPLVQAALGGLADGGLYEAILLMVLHYGPMGHSEAWPLLATAREMLQDVQSVSGRELISAALRHWIQDPTEAAAAQFFRTSILRPMEYLANTAVDILRADLQVA